jgi:glycyl-tRNA synthetase
MDYLDPYTGERYIPYIVESTYGLDRTVLALLCQAYDEELVDAAKNDVRTVLHLKPSIAPIKASVLPLSKKLGDKAMEIRDELAKHFMVDYDDTGSIGKRYRRADEIGTPYCITVDFATVGDENTPADNAVTIRDRDTMEQVRIPIGELAAWLEAHVR